MSLKCTHAWHMESTPAHAHVGHMRPCLAHGVSTPCTHARHMVSTFAHVYDAHAAQLHPCLAHVAQMHPCRAHGKHTRPCAHVALHLLLRASFSPLRGLLPRLRVLLRLCSLRVPWRPLCARMPWHWLFVVGCFLFVVCSLLFLVCCGFLVGCVVAALSRC